MTKEQMLKECVTPDEEVYKQCKESYERGKKRQTDKIFDELFDLLEGPAENQYLLITYQALKDMYREYLEGRR